MTTNIPMNELEKVVYGETELNSLSVAGCEWRKPYSITIPAKPTGVAGITVTRSASESNCGQLDTTSITANGTVLYGDTITVAATASTGFNNPTASFTSGVSSSKVTGNVAVSVTAGSRKTYTVSFTNPTYGAWESSSLTLPYGTTWSVSGNKITFTKPDNGGAVTNTVTAKSPTARTLSFATANYGSWNSTTAVSVYDYSYTTPTISGNATGTIGGTQTFTASDSRSAVTFTNSLSTTPTNTSTSGNHTWTIKGKTTAGADFTRTFTSTAHGAQYYYVISRSSTATSATSNITFTPTVTRSTHTYAITISNSSYGTVKNGSTAISSGDKVAYGTALTITPNTATAQYSYSASSSTGTISSNTLTVDGAETITFSRTLNSYAITINNSSYGTVKNGSTTITSGTKVNYGTTLTLTPTAATGYTTTVSSSTGTISSNQLTVDGAETITFNRTLNSYTLTISSITGVTNQVVTRTSSPYGKASTGALSNGATIYYGDVLSLSAVELVGYKPATVTSPVTVDGNVETSSYITRGDAVRETVQPPVIDEFIWEDDTHLSFGVCNENDFAVYLNYTIKDADRVEICSSSLSYRVEANSYSSYLTIPTNSSDYAIVECNFSAVDVSSLKVTGYAPNATLSAPVITSSSQQTDPTGLGTAAYLVAVTIKNNNSDTVTATVQWLDASTGAVAASTSTCTIGVGETKSVSTFVNARATTIKVKFTSVCYYASPVASATAVGALTAPVLANTSTNTASRTLTIRNSNPVAVQVRWTCKQADGVDITSMVTGSSSISAGGTAGYSVVGLKAGTLTITFSTWDGTLTSSKSFTYSAISDDSGGQSS